MKYESFDDAETFRRRVYGFLMADEIENNLILGISGGLRGKAEREAVMVAVEDGGRICLAAVMTPPYRMIVSKGDLAALPCLIDGMGIMELPGVIGLVHMSQAFAEEWRMKTGQTTTPATGMTLYALQDVVMPAPVAGAFRQAERSDFDRVSEWIGKFGEELSLPFERDNRHQVAEEKMKRRSVYFWEVDGAPASVASFSGATGNGVRVNFVYTPPAERGKGYASACVAHVSRRLIDSGMKWCAIFADEENPTSNGVYRRIGYRRAASYREYDFAP